MYNGRQKVKDTQDEITQTDEEIAKSLLIKKAKN